MNRSQNEKVLELCIIIDKGIKLKNLAFQDGEKKYVGLACVGSGNKLFFKSPNGLMRYVDYPELLH